ncbi:histidine kinase CKI1-like [Tasmannia lanceolata]|uniref:histidine kinase CKI1-like n=1 Tax=Tasmannia lanceolata TaxID=3420 RepID=UPI004064964D
MSDHNLQCVERGRKRGRRSYEGMTGKIRFLVAEKYEKHNDYLVHNGNTVAHHMFLAFSTAPYLLQISYIGEDGLFFSHYKEGNQTLSLFSNMSYSSFGYSPNNSTACHGYTQPVHDDTGIQYGEAIHSVPQICVSSSWFYDALNNKTGYSSWGLGWGRAQEPLLISIAPVKDFLPRGQGGVLSLGIPVKVIRNLMSSKDTHGWELYLVTKDGHVLVKTGFRHTSVVLNNGTISLQLMNSDSSEVQEAATEILFTLANYSDSADNLLIVSDVNILGMRYAFYCAALEIVGVQSLSILVFPREGFVSLVHGHNKVAMVMLILMIAIVIF